MLFFWVLCRYRKAQLALQKGEEDLAREALKRRKSYAVSCHTRKLVLVCFSLMCAGFSFLDTIALCTWICRIWCYHLIDYWFVTVAHEYVRYICLVRCEIWSLVDYWLIAKLHDYGTHIWLVTLLFWEQCYFFGAWRLIELSTCIIISNGNLPSSHQWELS